MPAGFFAKLQFFLGLLQPFGKRRSIGSISGLAAACISYTCITTFVPKSPSPLANRLQHRSDNLVHVQTVFADMLSMQLLAPGPLKAPGLFQVESNDEQVDFDIDS